MLRARVCDLFGVEHPIVLGGMGSGTSPALVTAVSNAGGLGIQGCAGRSAADITQLADAIRGGTQRPFGLNLLLFLAGEEHVDAVLRGGPPVVSLALARAQTHLRKLFQKAHDPGANGRPLVSTVQEGERA